MLNLWFTSTSVPMTLLMPRLMLRSIFASLLLSGLPLAATLAAPAAAPKPTTVASNRPMTAQQYIQQQHELRQDIKKMQQQVDQVSAAHQSVVAHNQALQLANDNLSVQVKVLQSEQSAQMFLYGATTIGIGGVMGFVLGSVMARRQRRW